MSEYLTSRFQLDMMSRVQNHLPKTVPQDTELKGDKYFLTNSPKNENTVELQWLKHLLNHINMFEAGVVQANEC